jgi:hypothetical protein
MSIFTKHLCPLECNVMKRVTSQSVRCVLSQKCVCHKMCDVTKHVISQNVLSTWCGEPAISLHSYTVPLVQWSNCLLPVMQDSGSIPRGVFMWNRDSSVSVVSLQWWPRCDWSLWPRLRRASSRTITRPSCWQFDIPTWSHTALLSQFHACCKSSFRASQLTQSAAEREPCGEPAISLHSYTVPLVQWSTCLLPVMRGPGSIPRGVLMWNRDSPVSVSHNNSVNITWQIALCYRNFT